MKLFLLFFPLLSFAQFLPKDLEKKFHVHYLKKEQLLNPQYMSQFSNDERKKVFFTKGGQQVDLKLLSVTLKGKRLNTIGDKDIHQSVFGLMASEEFIKKIKWISYQKKVSQKNCQKLLPQYDSETYLYQNKFEQRSFVIETHQLNNKFKCSTNSQRQFLSMMENEQCTLLQSTHRGCKGEKQRGLYLFKEVIGKLVYENFSFILLEKEKGVLVLELNSSGVKRTFNWD